MGYRPPPITQRIRPENNDISERYAALPGLGVVGRVFLTPGSSEPSVRRQLRLLAATPALVVIAWMKRHERTVTYVLADLVLPIS